MNKPKFKPNRNVSFASARVNAEMESSKSIDVGSLVKDDDFDSAISGGKVPKIESPDKDKVVAKENIHTLRLPSGRAVPVSLEYIEPSSIDLVFDGNCREIEENDIAPLKALIKETNGNTEAITVRYHPDKNSGYKYQIVVGKRRTRSCLELNLLVQAKIADIPYLDALTLATFENSGSQDFDNFELAAQMAALMKEKSVTMSTALAIFNAASPKRKDWTRTHIYKLLNANKIPSQIRNKLADKKNVDLNKITKLHKSIEAMQQLKPLNETVTIVLELIAEKGERCLTLELTKKINQWILQQNSGQDSEAKDVQVNQFEGRIYSDRFGKKMLTVASQPSGSPLIRFTKDVSAEQLSSILEFAEALFLKESE